jgi:hypothetical protein
LGWGGGGEVTGFCGGGGCSAEKVGGKLNRSGGREGEKIFGRKRRECPQIWACGPEPHLKIVLLNWAGSLFRLLYSPWPFYRTKPCVSAVFYKTPFGQICTFVTREHACRFLR